MLLHLVCEDPLSETVMQKLVNAAFKTTLQTVVIGKRGQGYIKNKINAFNNTNESMLFFVLTDLDQYECPPDIINKWFDRPCRKNLIFRIAVREVEAWLLADTRGFSDFVKLDESWIRKQTGNVEKIFNPKEILLSIVKRCKLRHLREDIIRVDKNQIKQGPGYNTRLQDFTENYWSIDRAKKNADSLFRSINSLLRLKQYF
ncbi:MAG: hypothetical protein JW969_02310 [Spirochaetales bacterium]|nr:hypothetical protein [Spirochaetales bacterium]